MVLQGGPGRGGEGGGRAKSLTSELLHVWSKTIGGCLKPDMEAVGKKSRIPAVSCMSQLDSRFCARPGLPGRQ